MKDDSYRQLLTKREAAMAYNRGLKKGIYVLEKAVGLTIEEHKRLVQALRAEIIKRETDCTLELLRSVFKGRHHDPGHRKAQ